MCMSGRSWLSQAPTKMPHLDLLLHVLDRVRGLHVVECNGLARQGLDEDLQATVAAQHHLERRLLLDAVAVVDQRDGLALHALSCRDNTSSIAVCEYMLKTSDPVSWQHGLWAWAVAVGVAEPIPECLTSIFCITFSTVSEGSTSRVMVLAGGASSSFMVPTVKASKRGTRRGVSIRLLSTLLSRFIRSAEP